MSMMMMMMMMMISDNNNNGYFCISLFFISCCPPFNESTDILSKVRLLLSKYLQHFKQSQIKMVGKVSFAK